MTYHGQMAWTILNVAGLFEVAWAIGTAYAVWVGIGAFGAALLGVLLFARTLTPARVGFLAPPLVSIVGLRLTGGAA